MNGRVFQLREESKGNLQSDKTCKELVRYVNKNYKYPDNVMTMITSVR